MTNKPALAATVSLGPLLDPWTGAHGGTPRFDLIQVTEIKPALLKGMDLKRAEIKTITATQLPYLRKYHRSLRRYRARFQPHQSHIRHLHVYYE